MPQVVAVTDTQAVVQNTESWLKKHERIVIVTLCLITGGWLFNHYLNNAARLDDLKVQQMQSQLVQQQNADKQLATQVQQTTAQYQALVNSLSQQNAQLAASIAARNTALVSQQSVDKSLPPTQLATRWSALVGFPTEDLNVQTSGILVSEDASVATVQQLEQVPVLTQNLKDVTIEDGNTKTELASANTLLGQQKQEISGLQTQITDSTASCKAQLSAEKANARKGKLKAFLYGVGVGVGAVVAAIIH